jgi:hypothetical protein
LLGVPLPPDLTKTDEVIGGAALNPQGGYQDFLASHRRLLSVTDAEEASALQREVQRVAGLAERGDRKLGAGPRLTGKFGGAAEPVGDTDPAARGEVRSWKNAGWSPLQPAAVTLARLLANTVSRSP